MFPLKSALIFSILFAFIVSGCSCFHEKPAQRVVVIKKRKTYSYARRGILYNFFQRHYGQQFAVAVYAYLLFRKSILVDVPQGGESWVKFIVYYYPDISEYKPLVSYCEFHIKRAQKSMGQDGIMESLALVKRR